MKFSRQVTSSRRKNRKRHFGADDAERRVRMSSGLSKELREKYKIKTLPIKKEDEVEVVTGDLSGKKGRVIDVKRAVYKVVLDITYREKKNGQIARYGIHPSNLRITGISMNDERMRLIKRKQEGREAGAEAALKKSAQMEIAS